MAFDDPYESELDLRDYLTVLRGHWFVIVACVAVTVGAAVGLSLAQTKIYTGEARLVLDTDAKGSVFDTGSGARVDAARLVQTEIEVLESRPLRLSVTETFAEQLDGEQAPKVSGSGVGQTDIMRVRVSHRDPELAAAMATEYATGYIELKRVQSVADLVDATEQVSAKMVELQNEVDAIDDRFEGADEAERSTLAIQRDRLVGQIALFRQTIDQLQVDANLSSGGAQLVEAAEVPEDPTSPKPLRNGVLAAVVGLMLGVGAAFLLDYLDDSLRDQNDFEQASGGVPFGAAIPVVAAWKKAQRSTVIAHDRPMSPASEAYRSLRTSVQFAGIDGNTKLIQVTSPLQSEGKTTTAVNLAYLIAQSGQRVCLVDADLRRPRTHTYLGLRAEVGLTDCIVGRSSVGGAVQQVPIDDDLFLLSAGPLPPNPSELLGSGRTAEILRLLSAEYDVVVVDTPPLLPVTDASVLVPRMDLVVLVSSVAVTSTRDLGRAATLLRRSGTPVIGVLNRAGDRRGGYGSSYGYGYGYGYVDDDDFEISSESSPRGRLRRKDREPHAGADSLAAPVPAAPPASRPASPTTPPAAPISPAPPVPAAPPPAAPAPTDAAVSSRVATSAPVEAPLFDQDIDDAPGHA